MKLNFKTLGQGPSLVILHGLFGSLDNWMTLSRQWSKNYTLFLVDCRNHGKSSHSEVFDYESMAGDLNEFLNQEGITRTHILGHSMGGKTAMRFSLNHPSRVERLIVADMSPVAYSAHHDSVFNALLPFPVEKMETRNEAEIWFKEKKIDEATRLFLLKSLDRKKEGGFEWKFNLQGIYHAYANILKEITCTNPIPNPVLFLRGGNSDYVKDEHWPKIVSCFPNASLSTIPFAGHWLHAEKPDAFSKAVLEFLEG